MAVGSLFILHQVEIDHGLRWTTITDLAWASPLHPGIVQENLREPSPKKDLSVRILEVEGPDYGAAQQDIAAHEMANQDIGVGMGHRS
jgi:hypothetical protein